MFAHGVGAEVQTPKVFTESPKDYQAVSRMIHAEVQCESLITKKAVGYVIASSARNAGLAPADAVKLDKGHYLSSYWLAYKYPRLIDIYYGEFTTFAHSKCADSSITAAKQALAIDGNTSIYHFDSLLPEVSWKKGLIAFQVNDKDDMYFFARTNAEKDKFIEVLTK